MSNIEQSTIIGNKGTVDSTDTNANFTSAAAVDNLISERCSDVAKKSSDSSTFFEYVKRWPIYRFFVRIIRLFHLVLNSITVEVNQVFLMFLLCLFLFVLLEYNEIQSSVPIPKPMFPSGSPVEDFYKGDLLNAMRQMRADEFTFFMLYSPWDADSQNLVHEFVNVAYHYGDQVNFKAVNCWQPKSQCNMKFGKDFVAPRLMAYRPESDQPAYYNGLLRATHIMRFLNYVINPVHRVSNLREIHELIGNYEIVVVCYISAIDDDQYQEIIKLALKMLTLYSFGELRVAVHMNTNDETPPSMRLFQWNSTLVYSSGNWSINNLYSWINKHSNRRTLWMKPMGFKSSELQPFFQSHPMLILFTPYNPLMESMDYYNILREVAFENWDPNNNTIKFIASIHSGRKKNRKNAKFWSNYCKKYDRNTLLVNTSEDDGVAKVATGAEYLEYYVKLKCWQLFLSESLPGFQLFAPLPVKSNVSAKSYYTRKIAMLAMDSVVFENFATILGLNLRNRQDHTGVVILDKETDTHYIMTENYNELNVRLFIQNFSHNRLNMSVFHRNFTSPKYKNIDCDQMRNQSNKICIHELVASTFLETISDQNKTFLVYFYSMQCGLCLKYSLMMLNLAHVFRNVSNFRLVRIDVDRNVFPWQYTVPTIPTFIFIPQLQKEDSKAYPADTGISEANIIRFLFGCKLSPEMRLEFTVIVCSHVKLKRSVCTPSILYQTIEEIKWNRYAILNQSALNNLHSLIEILHTFSANTNVTSTFGDIIDQLNKIVSKI